LLELRKLEALSLERSKHLRAVVNLEYCGIEGAHREADLFEIAVLRVCCWDGDGDLTVLVTASLMGCNHQQIKQTTALTLDSTPIGTFL